MFEFINEKDYECANCFEATFRRDVLTFQGCGKGEGKAKVDCSNQEDNTPTNLTVDHHCNY